MTFKQREFEKKRPREVERMRREDESVEGQEGDQGGQQRLIGFGSSKSASSPLPRADVEDGHPASIWAPRAVSEEVGSWKGRPVTVRLPPTACESHDVSQRVEALTDENAYPAAGVGQPHHRAGSTAKQNAISAGATGPERQDEGSPADGTEYGTPHDCGDHPLPAVQGQEANAASGNTDSVPVWEESTLHGSIDHGTKRLRPTAESWVPRHSVSDLTGNMEAIETRDTALRPNAQPFLPHGLHDVSESRSALYPGSIASQAEVVNDLPGSPDRGFSLSIIGSVALRPEAIPFIPPQRMESRLASELCTGSLDTATPESAEGSATHLATEVYDRLRRSVAPSPDPVPFTDRADFTSTEEETQPTETFDPLAYESGDVLGDIQDSTAESSPLVPVRHLPFALPTSADIASQGAGEPTARPSINVALSTASTSTDPDRRFRDWVFPLGRDVEPQPVIARRHTFDYPHRPSGRIATLPLPQTGVASTFPTRVHDVRGYLSDGIFESEPVLTVEDASASHSTRSSAEFPMRDVGCEMTVVIRNREKRERQSLTIGNSSMAFENRTIASRRRRQVWLFH